VLIQHLQKRKEFATMVDNNQPKPLHGSVDTIDQCSKPQFMHSYSGAHERHNEQQLNLQASDRDNRRHQVSTFMGKIPELEGYVYDVVTNDPTKSYQRTTEEIAEYVGRTLKDANKFRMGMVELSLPLLIEPKDPEDPTNPVQLRKWDTAWRQHQKKISDCKSNQGLVFGIILGQCTRAM
jgi:hypothetical protein